MTVVLSYVAVQAEAWGKPGRRFVAAKEAVRTLAALEFAIRSCQFWTLDLARQMLQETGPSNAWTRVSKIAYKAG